MTACLLLACVGWASEAAAAAQGGSREGLFGARPPVDGRSFAAPPVARYTSEEGEGFILDRSQGRPLLKFDGSPEVWVLQSNPAPRGDVIYKNDLGEPVLRATRLGGVTVFTETRPAGSAAALAGNGAPLRLAPIGPLALGERIYRESTRASRAARRQIAFIADNVTPRSSALLADTVVVVAEAVIRISRRPDNKRVQARFSKVVFVEGKAPAATLDRGVIQVTFAPDQGLAGRPSSERIVAVAAAY